MATLAVGYTPGLARRMGEGTGVQAISEALQKLAAGYALYFPDEKMAPTVSKVTLVARRHSDIARVELNFGGSTRKIYVKLHKKPQRRPHTSLETVRQMARREFELLTDQCEKFRAIPGCSVPRPIAFFPEQMAVVTEEAEGENLHRLIKKGASMWRSGAEIERLKEHCHAGGVWLDHFQRFTTQEQGQPLPADFLLGELRSDLKICVRMGMPGDSAIKALAFFEEQIRGVGDQPLPVVGEHPDFQPDNILISPGEITVLDFTNFRYGTRYNDVARFLVSLDFLSKNPLYSRQKVRSLMTAFLKGYGWRPGEQDRALNAYLMRCMAQTVATVSTWPYPALLKPIMERRTIRYFSAWCQRIIEAGDIFIENIVR